MCEPPASELVEVQMRAGLEVVVQQELHEFGSGLLAGEQLALGEHGGEGAPQLQISGETTRLQLHVCVQRTCDRNML